MSHLLDKWLDASRAGNAELAASIADASVSGNAQPYLPRQNYKPAKSVTVLEAVVKPKPIPIRPPTLAPPSIIPPGIMYPTTELVNHDGRGYGMPWTTGPGALANEEWPIGSILFYSGTRLGVSIGIYDSGESLRDLLVTYHQRNVRLRVHTGRGHMTNAGYDARREPGAVGDPEVPGALVPYDRPQPPRGGGLMDTLERAAGVAPSLDEDWVDIIPGVSTPFKRPTLGQLEDTLKYWAAWGDDFFTWDF